MQGSCLCGDVAFQIGDAPSNIYQCHCSLCCKQGGSSSNSALIVETREFQWLAGHERAASYMRRTGLRSDFCSRCGSPVPNPLGGAAYYWVPAGLLYDESNLKVAVHLFVGSKACWADIPSSGVHFDTMPRLTELVGLIHSET